MINITNGTRRLIRAPIATLSLLALLSVFLPFVAQQQSYAAPLSAAFSGELEHLFVAHNDTARFQNTKKKHDGGAGSENDVPQLLAGQACAPTTLLPDHLCVPAGAADRRIPSRPDFLTPLLRAPPLA